MRSKTSCFNKTIFVKNITRFWPMWALYLIILFFAMPMYLYQQTKPDRLTYALNLTGMKLSSMVNCVSNGIGINIVLTFLLSIGCAVLVFGYLFQARNCNMIHALPVQRKELFATNYMSGILFLIIPQIIAFLMSLVVCIINNVTCVEYLLYWLIISIALAFLFYSLAVFCCMLTGNAFAALVFFVVGNLIYIGIKYLIQLVIDTMSYGINNVNTGVIDFISTRDGIFSPITYLFTAIGFNSHYDTDSDTLLSASFYGGKVILVYIIAAVIAIIAAYLFYKKRHLECAGDIVTFKWMNPIFRWAVAFCFGIGLSLIVANIFFDDSRSYPLAMILFTIIFTLVCFFLSEMILKKNFRVFTKKRWIEGIICTVLTVLLLGACKADLFRLERKIPAADQVSVAVLEGTAYSMVLTDKQDIQALIDIHQSALDHKKAYQDFYYDEYYDSMNEDTDRGSDNYKTSASVNITYYLENGRSLRRYYVVPLSNGDLKDSDSTVYKLADLENNPEAYLASVICKNYNEVTYESAYLDIPYRSDDQTLYSQEYELNKEQAQTIYKALEQDIKEGNYPIGPESSLIPDEMHYYTSISFTGRVREAIDIYDVVPDRNYENPANSSYLNETMGDSEIYAGFELYSTCTHTIQTMIDLGIIEDATDLIPWSEYNETEAYYGVG